MKNGIAFIGLLLLVMLVTAPIFTACGNETATDEPREIRIGVMGAQTGPTASAVAPMLEELDYIFRYINEVEGGIDGVKLNWRIVNNQGTPEGAIITYKELRDSFSPLIYVSVEDYVLAGIQDMMTEDNAVVFTASALSPGLYSPPGRFFSLGIPVSDGFAGFVTWIIKDWQGNTAPRIGVLHWERQSGLQWMTAQSWVEKQGVELVPVSYPMTGMDLKPQLLQLSNAGVDYIWVLGISPHAALAIRDYLGLGLQIPLYFNEFVEGKVLLDLASPAAEGFHYYRAESPYSKDVPAAKLYSDIWQWGTGEEEWNDNRITITLKATIEAAVKQAVANVGWDNLDSDAIYTALNETTEIDTWGNVKKFGFGPDRRVGVSTIILRRFTTDGVVAASDWIELPRIFETASK